MTHITQTETIKSPQKNPVQRWTKRIWNMIPSAKAVIKGITYCITRFKNTALGFKKDVIEAARLVKQGWKTLNAFSSYKIKTPYAIATDCTLQEKPIIVKIESIDKGKRHFHGGVVYNGIVIDSNGEGNNTTDNGKMDIPEDTTASYFVLYPSKLGIDGEKLTHAMQTEALKKNDYDFYLNNCIDHIIRPMKEAGAKLDFGEVSTPKELCQWCDKMCFQENAGVVLNETEYQQLLKRLDTEKTISSQDLKFMHILSALQEPTQQASLKEKTAEYSEIFPCGKNISTIQEKKSEYSEQFPCGKNVPLLQERIADYPEKFACGQAVVRLANRRTEYPEQFCCGQITVQGRNNPTKKIQNDINQLAYGY